MNNFDLKKYLTENKITTSSKVLNKVEDLKKNLAENRYNAFDGNPEVKKVGDEISGLINKLRGLGNEAYGGEKKNVYSSEAGEAFKAFDKAWSDLANNLQSVDVKLSIRK